ncbi:MAG: CotH kinase family protein, partial [Chryseolinea sp.]
RDMGQYAPRTQFVEVILNSDYFGVYMLTEKIKVDKNRVNLSSVKKDDISGDDLTGGYILRIDKIDENDYAPWVTASSPFGVKLQYYEPKGDLVEVQRNYIRNFMNDFESTLNSADYANTYVWPNKYIGATYSDEVNFVKQWISDRLAWMDDNMIGNCNQLQQQ